MRKKSSMERHSRRKQQERTETKKEVKEDTSTRQEGRWERRKIIKGVKEDRNKNYSRKKWMIGVDTADNKIRIINTQLRC